MITENPNGDPGTEEFVRELTNHQTAMLAYIRSRVAGSSGARDLLQDVNITLWQRRDSFELGTNFKAWAFQTIRYHMLNQRRKLASQGWLVFDDDLLERMAPGSETDSDGLEERHIALRKCLARLRPKDRDLLFHRYATEAPLQEFADRTKRSAGTLKAILYNLRASLRLCIEREMKAISPEPAMNRNDHHLIQQVLDGDVSREEFDAFQRRLREEPELLRLYGDYALLQHTLCEEYEGGKAAGLRLLEPVRRSGRAATAIAIAAVLTLLAVVTFTRPWADRSAPEDVALLTFSVDAVWNIEGAKRTIGGATGVGKGSVLHLGCGRAGVSLSPTVTAFIEGPAEIEFRSGDSLFMKSGRGHFAASGGGLALETPRMISSDFGAEFGIEIPPHGAEEILVSSGEMRVVSKTAKEEIRLGAGDAAQIPKKGAMGRFPADDRRFAKALGRFRSVSPEEGDLTHFLRLPEADASVVLTTLDLGKPPEAAAGEGWPFMRFFSKGDEVLQLGTATTPDVPRTVTLRYDPRSGDVSLHAGGLPLGSVICSGKVPPGSGFDEIRMGALSGADVKALDIRVGLE